MKTTFTAGDLASHLLSDRSIDHVLKYMNPSNLDSSDDYNSTKIEETEYLEFKSGLIPASDTKISNPGSADENLWHILRAIIAMANSQGGCIIIGIDDKNHQPTDWDAAFHHDKSERQRFSDEVRDLLLPRKKKPSSFNTLENGKRREYAIKEEFVEKLRSSTEFQYCTWKQWPGCHFMAIVVHPIKGGELIVVSQKTFYSEAKNERPKLYVRREDGPGNEEVDIVECSCRYNELCNTHSAKTTDPKFNRWYQDYLGTTKHSTPRPLWLIGAILVSAVCMALLVIDSKVRQTQSTVTELAQHQTVITNIIKIRQPTPSKTERQFPTPPTPTPTKPAISNPPPVTSIHSDITHQPAHANRAVNKSADVATRSEANKRGSEANKRVLSAGLPDEYIHDHLRITPGRIQHLTAYSAPGGWANRSVHWHKIEIDPNFYFSELAPLLATHLESLSLQPPQEEIIEIRKPIGSVADELATTLRRDPVLGDRLNWEVFGVKAGSSGRFRFGGTGTMRSSRFDIGQTSGEVHQLKEGNHIHRVFLITELSDDFHNSNVGRARGKVFRLNDTEAAKFRDWAITHLQAKPGEFNAIIQTTNGDSVGSVSGHLFDKSEKLEFTFGAEEIRANDKVGLDGFIITPWLNGGGYECGYLPVPIPENDFGDHATFECKISVGKSVKATTTKLTPKVKKPNDQNTLHRKARDWAESNNLILGRNPGEGSPYITIFDGALPVNPSSHVSVLENVRNELYRILIFEGATNCIQRHGDDYVGCEVLTGFEEIDADERGRNQFHVCLVIRLSKTSTHPAPGHMLVSEYIRERHEKGLLGPSRYTDCNGKRWCIGFASTSNKGIFDNETLKKRAFNMAKFASAEFSIDEEANHTDSPFFSFKGKSPISKSAITTVACAIPDPQDNRLRAKLLAETLFNLPDDLCFLDAESVNHFNKGRMLHTLIEISPNQRNFAERISGPITSILKNIAEGAVRDYFCYRNKEKDTSEHALLACEYRESNSIDRFDIKTTGSEGLYSRLFSLALMEDNVYIRLNTDTIARSLPEERLQDGVYFAVIVPYNLPRVLVAKVNSDCAQVLNEWSQKKQSPRSILKIKLNDADGKTLHTTKWQPDWTSLNSMGFISMDNSKLPMFIIAPYLTLKSNSYLHWHKIETDLAAKVKKIDISPN